MLPRVFSLFTREHQPLDRARGGLGLAEENSLNRLLWAPANMARPERSEELATFSWLTTTETPRTFWQTCWAHGRTKCVLRSTGTRRSPSIEEFVPDVAVLDIGLPVMDGCELAHRLSEARSSPACAHCTHGVDFAHLQDAIGQVSEARAAV